MSAGGDGLAKVAHMALIGRDAELGRIGAFLGAVASGPVALLLEGELGIGKSALWNHGVASAAERGLRVLRCRPAECETQLAYAALGDLLADVPEAALADLPRPQRQALEVALLRVEPEGQESLQRAVALGLLGLLRALARIGGRAATAELTPAEARVAELLAAGSTYQQAADALFVSPKTVQWNVSKIYRKLGIASRAELVKHLDDSN
jgi:DNA-binding CsgD family transcriptional regulator